jgi:hypothetical protein
MELDEVFRALRTATMILSSPTVTFTQEDDDGEKERIPMSLQTLIIRLLAETLAERYVTKEAVVDALKINGYIDDEDEVPTEKCFSVMLGW